MTRPKHVSKPYGGYRTPDYEPLDHADELRRLLRVYEDCPGIVADLTRCLRALDQRRDHDAA